MNNKITEVFTTEDSKILDVRIGESPVQAAEIRVPGTDSWIVLLRCSKGLLGCRIFDLCTADKIRLPLAIFAVPHTEDMLSAKPVSLSEAARQMGATEEMTGAQIAGLFS